MMSDTPRSDSEILQNATCPSGSKLVYANFARQLERELAQAEAALEQLRVAISSLATELKPPVAMCYDEKNYLRLELSYRLRELVSTAAREGK